MSDLYSKKLKKNWTYHDSEHGNLRQGIGKWWFGKPLGFFSCLGNPRIGKDANHETWESYIETLEINHA